MLAAQTLFEIKVRKHPADHPHRVITYVIALLAELQSIHCENIVYGAGKVLKAIYTAQMLDYNAAVQNLDLVSQGPLQTFPAVELPLSSHILMSPHPEI